MSLLDLGGVRKSRTEGPRKRKAGLNGKGRNGANSSGDRDQRSTGTTTVVVVEEPPPPPPPTVDCVICYNGINVSLRKGYMLAPCDHIFHRECLEQWMDVKMECPICRKELPAL